MKFLCDRCKTRYSIGDERVRGKILKIRCKSCANVITVREGMGLDPDAPPAPVRAKKSTTIAPPPFDEGNAAPGSQPARFGDRSPTTNPGRGGAAAAGRAASREPAMTTAGAGRGPATRESSRGGEAPGGALNAAFASAMARPAPAAAQEEWYVSIDGEQAGPYSLAEAQRWIAQKPLDADLHCWSEGFDDWLPVDKVSQFRGLRKRAPADAPPPVPRGPGAPRTNAASRPAAAEDEPKPLFAATMATLERGKPAVSGLGLPTPPAGSPSARATPPGGTPLAGRGSARALDGNGAAARPADARASDPADARRASAGKTAGPAKSPGVDPFDRASRPPDHDAPEGRGAQPQPSAGGADDDLHIGEVSRVVNLTDLARSARAPAAPSRRTATPAVGTRVPTAAPAFRSTGSFPSVPAPAAAEGDVSLSMMPAVRSHRRGMIALIAVALAMVLGVIGAVIVFVARDDDATGGSLGTVHAIDTSRPEDPITHRPMPSAAAPTPAPPAPSPPRPSPPRVRTPSPATGGAGPSAELPVGNALSGDEIEVVARKYQDMTNRCHKRSQRGADSILIGEVKKIAVTLTIDRDGSVSELQLSDHAGDNLGKCLTTMIKTWKFRTSPGGTFRFSLNFVDG